MDSCQICQLLPKKHTKHFKTEVQNFACRPEALLFAQRVACRNTCNTRIMGFPIPKNHVTFGRSVVLSLVWHLLHRINWLTCKYATLSVWPGFDERRSKPIRRMTYIHVQICDACETLLPWQKETLNVVLLMMIVKSTYLDYIWRVWWSIVLWWFAWIKNWPVN